MSLLPDVVMMVIVRGKVLELLLVSKLTSTPGWTIFSHILVLRNKDLFTMVMIRLYSKFCHS